MGMNMVKFPIYWGHKPEGYKEISDPFYPRPYHPTPPYSPDSSPPYSPVQGPIVVPSHSPSPEIIPVRIPMPDLSDDDDSSIITVTDSLATSTFLGDHDDFNGIGLKHFHSDSFDGILKHIADEVSPANFAVDPNVTLRSVASVSEVDIDSDGYGMFCFPAVIPDP